MSVITPSALHALFAVSGLGVGAAAGWCHGRGWYRREGDPAPDRVTPVVVALATGLVWWLLGRSLPADPTPAGMAVIALRLGVMTIATALAGVDAAVRRLPDALTVPTAAIVMSTFVAIRLMAPAPVTQDAERALLAGVLVPATLLLAAVTIGGVGLGDVKLSCPLAALLGAHGTAALGTGLVLAWAGAGVWAAGLLVLGRADRSTAIPLGPFLWVGALAGLVG